MVAILHHKALCPISETTSEVIDVTPRLRLATHREMKSSSDTFAAEAGVRSVGRLRPTLGRSAVASGVATLLDGVIAWSLTLLLYVPGTASTLIGAVAGGVMNWLLNRHWAFRSRGAVGREAFRYALVSAVAALLNTLGVAWLEAPLGFRGAWLVTRVGVFCGFTFVLFRAFVFRHAIRGTAPSSREDR